MFRRTSISLRKFIAPLTRSLEEKIASGELIRDERQMKAAKILSRLQNVIINYDWKPVVEPAAGKEESVGADEKNNEKQQQEKQQLLAPKGGE